MPLLLDKVDFGRLVNVTKITSSSGSSSYLYRCPVGFVNTIYMNAIENDIHS